MLETMKMNRQKIFMVVLTVLIFAVMLVLCNAGYAGEGGTDAPWNDGLTKLVNAFSGKTALLITCIGLFVLAGMAIFGGDLGVVGKGLMMVVIAGSLLTGLMTIVKFFFGEGFCI